MTPRKYHQSFTLAKEYLRAIQAIKYYKFSTPLRLSKFLLLDEKRQKEILKVLNEELVKILAFCLMPNHFHRDGSLFLGQFKYERFVFDQANYQVSLKEIKHLILENP